MTTAEAMLLNSQCDNSDNVTTAEAMLLNSQWDNSVNVTAAKAMLVNSRCSATVCQHLSSSVAFLCERSC